MARRQILVLLTVVFVTGLVAGAVIGDSSGDADEAKVDGGPASAAERSAGSPSAPTSPSEGEPASPNEVAIEFATASQEWLYLTDEQIDAAVRDIAVPDRADQLSRETVSELSIARDGLRFSAGRIWWFVRPLATKVISETETRAEVSVWIVTVLSAADVAVPQADWVTLDVVLLRSGGRWLLESITDTVGPTPVSGVRDQPWQPEPFDDALDGFERIGSETS